MGKAAVPIILAFMMLAPILISMGGPDRSSASASLTPRGPIIIEGDAQMASHPALRSGTGTPTDPYVFSDYLIDSRAGKAGSIAVRNVTKNFIFRNMTIYTSSPATAITVVAKYSGSWIPVPGTFQNVTVIGTGRHMNLYVTTFISIIECTFVNYQTSGDLFYTYYANEFHIVNNTFDAPHSRINMDTAYNYNFKKNRGSIGVFESNYFIYCDFANNTLKLDRMTVIRGYASDIQGNRLTSNSTTSELVMVIDCNRIKIANNTMYGGKNALYISHPNTNNPVATYYWAAGGMLIEFNNISWSDVGILLYWTTGHPYTAYFSIHDNDFYRCKGFAIDHYAAGSPTSIISRNRFIGNNGATSKYYTANAQARDQYGVLSWQSSKMGNYWSDWTEPDDDSNGLVDWGSYMLSSAARTQDQLPVTNPYFDFEPPTVEILTPRGLFVPSSYLNLSWRGIDDGSGFDRMMIKQNNAGWVTVDDRSYCAFHIVKGQYTFLLKGYDRANLTTTLEVQYSLNQTRSPLDITYPGGGSYVSNIVDVEWALAPGFVPKEITSTLDGSPPKTISPDDDLVLNLLEGAHSLDLEASDFHGITETARVDFNVDTHPPTLVFKYPSPGAVLSNKIVYFNWSSYDISGISSTRVRIDGGGWIIPQGSYYSTMLTEGTHNATVSVTDMAGYRTSRTVDFTISENTSLSITGPDIKGPTSKREHIVTWEYLSPFETANLEVILNSGFGTPLPLDSKYCSVTLEEEGRNTIKIQAKDPLGNTISDTLEIVLDTLPPRPNLLMPDPYYLRTKTNLLEWSVSEDVGIDHFELFVDGSKVGGKILDNGYPVTMEEGSHLVLLVAYDQAGNRGETNATVIIDMTPPELVLVSPLRGIIDHVPFKFSWIGSDSNGIHNYTLSFGQGSTGRSYPAGTDTFKVLEIEEGLSTMSLSCLDLAMNEAVLRREIVTDLYPPTVSLLGGERLFTNGEVFSLEWEAFDSAFIASQAIEVGTTVTPLNASVREYPIQVIEGSTRVTLTVTDGAGRNVTDSIEIVGDRTIPVIEKDGEAIVVGADAVIVWTAGNDTGLVWNLYLDGILIPSFDWKEGSYRFNGLEEGDHVANLTVSDQAGNSKTLSWTFTIEGVGQSEGEEGGSILLPVLAAIAAIALVLCGAGYLLFMRGGKQEPVKAPTAPKRPERLSISRVNIPVARPAHPAAIEMPPVKDEHYIRPKPREAPAVRRIEHPPHPAEGTRAPSPISRPTPQHPSAERPSVVLPREPPQEEVPEWDEDKGDEELEEFEDWEEA